MKYITKKIYNAMQWYNFFPEKTSNKACIYSEEFFKYLYTKNENKYIKQMKHFLNLTVEELFPDLDVVNNDEHSIEDKEKHNKLMEEKRRDYVPYGFKLDEVKQWFKDSYNNNLSIMRKLPKSILDEIADIRVLALGYSSLKVKRLIEKYGKIQEQIVYDALDKYKADKNRIDEDKIEDIIWFYNSPIKNYNIKNQIFEIYLDKLDSFSSEPYKIEFKDYNIIKMEKDIKDMQCAYQEFYKYGDVYEAHMLFLDKKNRLNDFIISFSDIEYYKLGKEK